MTVGTLGFVGARLREARQSRGLTQAALAEVINVTPQSVSQYESDRQSPGVETLGAIAGCLNFPRLYFLRPTVPEDVSPIFWRSKASATKASREKSEIRLIWLRDIHDYLSEFLDFPRIDFPQIEVPQDFREIDTDFLEQTAKTLREYWRIGDDGPMPDLLLEMENNGIIISRIYVGAEKQDAFSQWSKTDNIPLVVLAKDKASAVRQRFDAAHELAHLLLHQNVQDKRLNTPSDNKIIEDQAHYFAGALLLPEQEFVNELWAPTLDGMLALKERWKVSIGCMISRCKALSIVDDEEYRRLWINYNRRGWRKSEPLDNKLEKERPRILRRSFTKLLSEKVQSISQILTAIPLPPRDIDELCDLDPGTLGGDESDLRAMPQLKHGISGDGESKVVQLFESK